MVDWRRFVLVVAVLGDFAACLRGLGWCCGAIARVSVLLVIWACWGILLCVGLV